MDGIIYLDLMTREWVFPDGTRLPIVAGGSTMNSDDLNSDPGMDIDLDTSGDDADADADADAGDDDDVDDDWNPPTKTEWERIRAALKNERRDRKKVQREFEDKVKNLTTSGSAAAEVEVEKARIEERDKVEKKWLKRTIRAEAAAQFAAQGASATNAERLARMVDLDKVSFDDRDDEIEGLEEEIEEIMAENPEFFRKPKDDDKDTGPVLRRPKIDGASRGSRGGGSTRKMSSAEKLAAQALGRSARRR